MPQTLMHAKLHKPHLDYSLVARPNLVQRIRAGAQAGVTLVVAPAGYGKTTIVTQWAAEAELPVAWFAIDESDNDLVRFLSYLAAAIQTIFPDACPRLLGLLDRSPLPDVERLAVTLSNDIDALPHRIALVLDDYHWITEPDVQCVLNEFLRHPVRKLHLVLTSRSQPALALSRLRGSRYLCELHMQDLRLTEPEAAALLAQRIPVALSSEEVTVLVARTEGWAAGLHLAALSLEAEGSIDSYTADYLLEQVLQQQQPVVRDFLLKTSILDRLSPDLAEAVVGSEQSATGITLQALARKGLFLQATDRSADGSEAWYTVHRLFRTLLRQQLEAAASPSQVAVLHRRASAWYCRSGFYDEALQHALAAYDTPLAVQTVVDHFAGWLEQERWRTIERRLNLLPADTLDQHPWLLMARGHLLLLQFKWNAVLPLLTRAEQRLIEGQYQLAPAKARLLRCYLDVLWAVHWSSTSEPQKAIEAAQRAILELPIDHYYVRGMLQLALTLSLQVTGQVELAEQMLMAAVAQAELAPSGSPAPLRPLLCLISVYFTEGNMVAAAQMSRSLLQKAQAAKSLFNQQIAYLAMGAAAYEMNELEAAADAFERGADLRHVGNVRAGHECLVGRALACHALGRSEAVRATIAMLADYHAEVASSVLTAEAISLQRRLGLLKSGFSGGDLLRRSVAVRASMWYGWLEIPAITQIRAALAYSQPTANGQGRTLAQVDAALQQLLAVAVELHKPSYLAALLALQAVLLQRRKQPAAALEALRQAVVLGEERGLMRCIADAGPQLDPLLAQLASVQPSEYLDRLCAAIGVAAARPLPRETTLALARLAEPLTRREREVLNLLGQHRTDREIAEALVISPLTVRTHIENLSSKLSVNGRRAIVSRAREYGLLA